MIGVSIAAGIATVGVRAADGSSDVVRLLEGTTLVLAAAAYLLYVLAHHAQLARVATRLILVAAFILWAVVQLAPTFSGTALLNDVVILLFVADLAILLSPAQ